MRILAVLHFPEFGGPHNQLARLGTPLEAREWTLVTVLPEGVGTDRLRTAGGRVRNLSLGRVRAVPSFAVQARMLGRLPLDLLQLARVFRAERPDVVQLSSLMNPHAAYVAKAMGIPVVWQIVDTRPPMRLRRIMMAQIRWLADVVMPIGEAVRDAHPGAAEFGERCIQFFPPVDLDEFHPNGEATLREEFGIAAQKPIVTVIGNINPQKGHEYFLSAAAQVKEEHPDAVFIIAGHLYDNHREYYERLVSQAAADGLLIGKNLHFLGSRQDIPNILRSSDVFALASVPNSEGLPTVILEAMACGVPVIASDVASVKEAVVDGETGFVVPSLDPSSMASRIDLLLTDDDLRTRMRTAARARAETSYSLGQYVDAHIQAYERAIAHNAQRPSVRWRKRKD